MVERGWWALGIGVGLCASLSAGCSRTLESADAQLARGVDGGATAPPSGSSTDADAVYLSRHGIATGLVSVPLRYMHSPVEMADLEDIERAVQLVVAFALKLDSGLDLAG